VDEYMEISGGINQLLESLNQIHITNEADKGLIEKIKEDLRNNEIADAMKKLQVFNSRRENDEDVDEEESEVEEKPKNKENQKTKKVIFQRKAHIQKNYKMIN
jgi:hypothetical protein